MQTIAIDSVGAYNNLYGLPTDHPLVTVVDLTRATETVNHIRMDYGVYALYIKNGINCRLKYGRQDYDYQEGTIVSFAPGQIVEVEMLQDEFRPEVSGLIFHPDLLYGTPLAARMNRYTFFGYAQNEALHLSAQERDIITDLLGKIRDEISGPSDRHSRELLCLYIELILDYCMRFYDRQFKTREKAEHSIVSRFESLLDDYLDDSGKTAEGFPTVGYFAGRVNLSPGYFGDLIKRETGKTAQEYIQSRIIGKSKILLGDSKLKISNIAYSLGFQYPQHFIRLFRKIEGCTPGEFRKNMQRG